MAIKPRKYKSEYARYQAATTQKKKRAARNKARRMMVKSGAVRPGDKKDVAHRNGNPLDNKATNLKVVSKSKNRSYKRTRNSKKVRATA